MLNPFFASEAWTASWLETLGRGARAHRLELPGAPAIELAARRREGFRLLRPAGGDVADYEELPIDGSGAGTLAATVELMRSARADALRLAHVPEGSATLAWARGAGVGAGVATARRGESYVAALAGDWETQRGRLRPKLVSDTARCERRLAESAGELRVERVATPAAIGETVDFIARHHRARHNALGRYSMFERAPVRDFYRRVGERSAGDPRLHVTRLLAGARVVAAHLGFATDERLLYYLPTFDADYARYAPGRVLALWLMRDSIERGRRFFDLGNGDEPYKREFSPEPLPQYTVFVAAPTVRGRAARRWFIDARPAVGRRLERLAPVLYRLRILREMS